LSIATIYGYSEPLAGFSRVYGRHSGKGYTNLRAKVKDSVFGNLAMEEYCDFLELLSRPSNPIQADGVDMIKL
jgi:hypothetical protein